MKTGTVILLLSCILHNAAGQLTYKVYPTNITINVGAPVCFRIEVKNEGNTPVVGVFRPDDRSGIIGTTIQIGRKGDREKDFYYYAGSTGFDV